MFLLRTGVFVGSGIFKSANAADRAKAIVQATTHYKDAKVCPSVTQYTTPHSFPQIKFSRVVYIRGEEVFFLSSRMSVSSSLDKGK